MNFKKALGVATVAVCTISGHLAFSQANVVENEPKVIYVNAASGLDTNPGTAVQPTQTIQAALNKAITSANAGVGAKVMIAPGTYHESLNINSNGNAAITIQASTPGTAVIDGADVVTGWSGASSGGVYTASWVDTVGGCPLPPNWFTGMPPVVQANEMVFVNGALMTQVMSSSQLGPGMFYVNAGSSQVQLYPPSGTDMGSATVEIASRRSLLTASGKNLVFRGLTFQHAASCLNQNAVTINGGSNVLFDSDTANWNNWGGIVLNGSTNVTVQNTTASNNGGSGLGGFQDTNSAWSNNETDFNNWRGSMIGLYDFAQGGTKLGRARTATITGQKSYYNASQGLWFDTDNENVTINGANLVGNMVGNMQLEASEGPFLVENSTICNGAGVQIINTSGITFSGNTFYNNGGTKFQNAQLYLAGNASGRTFTNWTTHQSTTTWTTGMKLQNNNFIAVGSGQYVFNTYVTGTPWSMFVNSLSSNYNNWYNSSNTSDFIAPAGKSITFAGWRSTTLQDSGSSWSSAAASCGAPASVYSDFQLLAHNAASWVSSYTMSGGTVSIPLQLRSFNFGTVTLSASGLPSGVSASFSNSSLVSGNTTLTLTASTSAVSQTALITIFGVSGSRVHAVTVKVTVQPA